MKTSNGMTKIPHYQRDYYKGILGIYNRRIMRRFIRIGKLEQEKGLILDFGCGVGHLKKKLSGGNVIGYDINPSLSDVDDYRRLGPSKIVASASLQYLSMEELRDFLQYAIRQKAELITVIPTENVFAKMAMAITNKPYAHDDHKLRYRTINREIEKHYRITKREYLWLAMAQLTLYELN